MQVDRVIGEIVAKTFWKRAIYKPVLMETRTGRQFMFFSKLDALALWSDDASVEEKWKITKDVRWMVIGTDARARTKDEEAATSRVAKKKSGKWGKMRSKLFAGVKGERSGYGARNGKQFNASLRKHRERYIDLKCG